MAVVFCVSIVSVFLAYLAYRNRQYPQTILKLSFVGITFLQMIHYDFGNDYLGYLEDHMMYNISWNEILRLWIIKHGAFKDLGWVVIQMAFPGKYGFFVFVAIISIIQSWVYYNFIKEYVVPQHYWKALFIYLFTTSYYVMSFSALRQGLAISLCLLSFMVAFKGKTIKAIIIVIIAATIHTSAVVVLPFLFFTKMKLKHGRMIATFFVVVSLVAYLSSSCIVFFYTFFINHMPLVARNYGHYIETMSGSNDGVGIGWLINSVVYVVLIWFMYNKFEIFTKEQRVMIILMCISFLLTPFSVLISGIISRLQSYFTIVEIAVVPLVYSKIRDRFVKAGVVSAYVFMMAYNYYNFFFVTEWSAESYRVFKSIFRVL